MEHNDAVHHYSEKTTPFHALDVRIKIIVTLTFVLLLVSFPPYAIFGFTIFSGLLLWCIAASLIPLSFLLKRASLVLPFSVLIALPLPFFHGGESINIFGFSLSHMGLWLFFGATIKAFLCATSIMLLVCTTPFHSLMANMRHLGISALFVDVIALTYRYIFVLTEEISRLQRAAIARGYKPKWLPQSIIVGRLIGNLFLRSYEHAERVYDAMRLRGYHGELPETNITPLTNKQKLGILFTIIFLCVIRLGL